MPLGVFLSGTELSKQSKETFGVRLHRVYIRKVCNGEKEEYKGFAFRDIDTNDNKEISLSA